MAQQQGTLVSSKDPSQLPTSTLQLKPVLTPGSEDLTSSFGVYGHYTCMLYTDLCSQSTHTFNIIVIIIIIILNEVSE